MQKERHLAEARSILCDAQVNYDSQDGGGGRAGRSIRWNDLHVSKSSIQFFFSLEVVTSARAFCPLLLFFVCCPLPSSFIPGTRHLRLVNYHAHARMSPAWRVRCLCPRSRRTLPACGKPRAVEFPSRARNCTKTRRTSTCAFAAGLFRWSFVMCESEISGLLVLVRMPSSNETGHAQTSDAYTCGAHTGYRVNLIEHGSSLT